MTIRQDFEISVAPMMDRTDRHCRFFHRLLSRHVVLYTEMITARALIHGDAARLLHFDAAEHPVVLQVGGAEPAELAQAARLGAAVGYDAINLNVGCPSNRVQSGAFGAALMAQPHAVADCVAAMQDAVSIPVSVKCRIGIDDQNLAETLLRFIETVAAAPCQSFIIHARKAWLKGLSPKDNRTVPPLDYALVHAIKRARPDLRIHLNGGLADVPHALAAAAGLDGAMLGRAACQSPWILGQIDGLAEGDGACLPDRAGVVQKLVEYAARETAAGTPLPAITRHIGGLFAGLPGARQWRRLLAEEAPKPGAGAHLIARAAEAVLGQKWAA